jgi:hypothetical protein
MMLLPPGRVHIYEAAVDAAHGLPVIQVNVDLGVTQGATAAVTRDDTLVDNDRGHFGDEVDGELIIDLLLQAGHREPRVPGVPLLPLLAGVGGLVQCWLAHGQRPRHCHLGQLGQAAQDLTGKSHCCLCPEPESSHILPKGKNFVVFLTLP